MWGAFGCVDIDNDTDDMLVMHLSSLHISSIPRESRGIKGCDESWLKSSVPQDMIKILGKYSDRKWLRRHQHNYCIFYACDIISGLCGLSAQACLKLLNTPTFIDSLLSLWVRKLTWFEQRVATRTLSMIFGTSDLAIPMFIKNKYSINLFEEALKQYTQCIHYVIKRCMVASDRWKSGEGYVQDLVLKVKGRSMQYDDETTFECVRFCAEDWMTYNGSLLVHLAKYALKNEETMKLFLALDMELISKACEMDLCYYWFLQKPEIDPDTFMDALIRLSDNATVCHMIAKNEIIIKSLILTLTSRCILHFRYDLIILNLLKNECIARKYYYDLCVSLIALLDVDKTYNGMPKCFSNYGHCHFFDSVISSLKLIFNISLEIEFMESKKIIKKYKCCACKQIVRFPQMIPCGHTYCYLCIINKLKTDCTNAKCLVKKCTNKDFIFTAKEEKINVKLLNKMNASTVKAEVNTNTYIGPLHKYWPFIKENLDTTAINDLELYTEFEYFCDFMSKETAVASNKVFKQLRIEGRNKRNEGNEFFKQKRYNAAIDCYIQALQLCPNKYKQDRIVYYSNLAIAYFKAQQILNAYKTALSGLCINADHCKLSHILSECYSQKNITQLTTNIVNKETFNISNDNLFVNRVYNVLLFRFYSSFAGSYLSKKNKHRNAEFKDMTPSERDTVVLEILRKEATEEKQDTLLTELQEKPKEIVKHKIHFIQDYYEKYCKEYFEFKQRRQRAKREIYSLLIRILANKGKIWVYESDSDLENEEYVAIYDLMEIVRGKLYLGKELRNIEPSKQNILISSFIAKTCLGLEECNMDEIPAVIVDLIQNLVFSKHKYDAYKMDGWGVKQLVRKSSYLTVSEEPVYDDDCYSDSNYGLKLTDSTKTCDNNWREQEFSDHDSGIEEFRSK